MRVFDSISCIEVFIVPLSRSDALEQSHHVLWLEASIQGSGPGGRFCQSQHCLLAQALCLRTLPSDRDRKLDSISFGVHLGVVV